MTERRAYTRRSDQVVARFNGPLPGAERVRRGGEHRRLGRCAATRPARGRPSEERAIEASGMDYAYFWPGDQEKQQLL